jgi:hypothetical protein
MNPVDLILQNYLRKREMATTINTMIATTKNIPVHTPALNIPAMAVHELNNVVIKKSKNKFRKFLVI